MTKQEINPTPQQIHLLCMLWAKKATITQNHNGYFLTLKNIDPKVLYMTARPSKNRAFITVENFITCWIKNNNSFKAEPPEIAITYSKMAPDNYGVAEAIPIALCDPKLQGKKNYTFQLNFLAEKITPGEYDEICLFIDWLPSFECPEPIRLVLPNLL